MQLAQIHTYPIKSCSAITHSSAFLTPSGFRYDRLFALIDSDSTVVTQRDEHALASVRTQIDGDELLVDAPGMTTLTISLAEPVNSARVLVQIWNDNCSAMLLNADVHQWFCQFLNRDDVRVVRMPDQSERAFFPKNAASGGVQNFFDSRPVLVATSASLDDLNSRLPVPVPMNRFRPNLVVSGTKPFAEDSWQIIKIGDIELRRAKSCTRCVVTTIDQESGVKQGVEPLKALSRFRRADGGVVFGQYFVPVHAGQVALGVDVFVLS